MKYLPAALCVLMGCSLAWSQDPSAEVLPVTLVEPPPDRLPIPRVGLAPEVPELPAAPIEIEAMPIRVAGRGPLFIDLQSYRPVGRDLAAFQMLGPDARGLIWGDNEPIHARIDQDTAFMVSGPIRAFYRNDQRIEWSGVESTFGAEAAALPTFVTRKDNWLVTAHGEFFLNKRYGSSMLRGEIHDTYRANFDVDTFEIFQLFIEATYDDLSIRLGRSRTPFGRYQSPMFSNSMFDAQFLRTEVIGFVENGLFLRYQPGLIVIDAACVNGEPDLDTNSSKAGVVRVGFEEEFWTVGVSAKYQDGISSEHQKRYDNQIGVDASVVFGRWTIYSEAVYDQHGFHNDPTPTLDYPAGIGRRSLYGRDVFRSEDLPASGAGAYLGVTCRGETWVADVSYGYYRPNEIGDPSHDEPINRLLLKAAYRPARHLQFFVEGLVENRRPLDPLLSRMNPYAVYAGMQYGF